MLVLMSLRGLNGGMASTILTQSGVTIDPELQSVSFPAFMILGTIIAMSLVEWFELRLILSVTSLVSVVSLARLASASWSRLRVAGRQAGCMSEMFNFQMRAKVMGILAGLASGIKK